MAKRVVVTEREVRLARAFLAALRGNIRNGYLLLALIAWFRAMGKAKDPFWRSLAGWAPARAGRALADKLARRASMHPNQYKGVLAALRRGAGTNTAQVRQARDFMLGIEMSPWDRKHYGYRPFTEGHWTVERRRLGGGDYVDQLLWVPAQDARDPLAVIWAGLTGHPIPPQWFTDVTPAQKAKPARPIPPRPSQPRSLEHVLPKPDYINPYGALDFYNGRPHGDANVQEQDEAW
jgi:hypothetical protein